MIIFNDLTFTRRSLPWAWTLSNCRFHTSFISSSIRLAYSSDWLEGVAKEASGRYEGNWRFKLVTNKILSKREEFSAHASEKINYWRKMRHSWYLPNRIKMWNWDKNGDQRLFLKFYEHFHGWKNVENTFSCISWLRLKSFELISENDTRATLIWDRSELSSALLYLFTCVCSFFSPVRHDIIFQRSHFTLDYAIFNLLSCHAVHNSFQSRKKKLRVPLINDFSSCDGVKFSQFIRARFSTRSECSRSCGATRYLIWKQTKKPFRAQKKVHSFFQQFLLAH